MIMLVSSANKEIRFMQSRLRDVEKLLKLDSGNTELLAQKHKPLGKVFSETGVVSPVDPIV